MANLATGKGHAFLYAALRSVNKLSLPKNFCDDSGTKEVYQRAYEPIMKMSPCVTMDELTRLEKHQPLTVSKKRGRPKKSKRIESQAATEAFKKKRSNKCTTCGDYGHNKRTCKG